MTGQCERAGDLRCCCCCAYLLFFTPSPRGWFFTPAHVADDWTTRASRRPLLLLRWCDFFYFYHLAERTVFTSAHVADDWATRASRRPPLLLLLYCARVLATATDSTHADVSQARADEANRRSLPASPQTYLVSGATAARVCDRCRTCPLQTR